MRTGMILDLRYRENNAAQAATDRGQMPRQRQALANLVAGLT